MFFDAHIHLQRMSDLPTVIEKAQKAGVQGFICNATHPNDWDQVLDIAQKYNMVYPALGVHPWYVESLPPDWDKKLELLLRQNPALMVGEIGLDNTRQNMDLQEKVLRRQLDLAALYHRPVHIHCVRAWDRLLHIFKTQRKIMPPKILSHSHHGNKDLISEMIAKYNAYFSYSSIVLPENRAKVRACLIATPLDRLMAESDAPDLMPDPALLEALVDKIAQIRNADKTQIKQALYHNAMEFING